MGVEPTNNITAFSGLPLYLSLRTRPLNLTVNLFSRTQTAVRSGKVWSVITTRRVWTLLELHPVYSFIKIKFVPSGFDSGLFISGFNHRTPSQTHTVLRHTISCKHNTDIIPMLCDLMPVSALAFAFSLACIEGNEIFYCHDRCDLSTLSSAPCIVCMS